MTNEEKRYFKQDKVDDEERKLISQFKYIKKRASE